MPAYSAMSAMIVSRMPQRIEVRVHQVARIGHPPAGACERQERAQRLEAGDEEHHDGGEGHHTWPVRRCPSSDRTARRGADPSRGRLDVLISHFLSPLISRSLVSRFVVNCHQSTLHRLSNLATVRLAPCYGPPGGGAWPSPIVKHSASVNVLLFHNVLGDVLSSLHLEGIPLMGACHDIW